MPPLPADSIHARACKLKCEKILTRPGAQNGPHASTAFPDIPFYLMGNTWRYCREKKEPQMADWPSAV